jgi:hypothetical protein
VLTRITPGLPSAVAVQVSGNTLQGRVQSLEQQLASLAAEHNRLLDAVRSAFEDLNREGALDIADAAIVASRGIKFPATQNDSTDANTLDDYEEGTWTPVLTFETPGDLAVTYSTQTGDYTKIGRIGVLNFAIVTSAFTHTTAAGAMQITGSPLTCGATRSVGSMFWRGITKAGYTEVAPYMASSTATILAGASGSGVAPADVAFGDMPTGGTVLMMGTLVVRV